MSDAVPSVADGLPLLYRAMLPELAALRWPEESRATCADCVMRPEAPGLRPGWPTFADPSRCCTYAPSLPNHVAGRILRRGGEGAARLRARLEETLDGVEVSHVHAPGAMRRAYDGRRPGDFGNRADLRCSYWSQGRCTIHVDRVASCRTWFCRSVDGRHGQLSWSALRAGLFAVEEALAERCVMDGAAPREGASMEAFVEWYRWCAAHVDGLPPQSLAPERGAAIRAAVERRDQPLPDVVVPLVTHRVGSGDDLGLSAWSLYDLTRAPGWLFRFLSRLDGQRTWREALTATRAEWDAPIAGDWPERLWRLGLLSRPDDHMATSDDVARDGLVGMQIEIVGSTPAVDRPQ